MTEQQVPCRACSALWTRFEQTGQADTKLLHLACVSELCGPPTNPPVETLVKRRMPQPVAPGTKGWWEKP